MTREREPAVAEAVVQVNPVRRLPAGRGVSDVLVVAPPGVPRQRRGRSAGGARWKPGMSTVVTADVGLAVVVLVVWRQGALLAAAEGLALLLMGGAGLYRRRLSLSVLDDLPILLGRPLAASAATVAVGAVAHVATDDATVVLASATFAGLLTVSRVLGYAWVRRRRLSGASGHRTLIVGAGRIGGRLAEAMTDHPEYGLRPVGFIDNDPMLAPAELPVPLVGTEGELAQVIQRLNIDVVIMAFGSLSDPDRVEVIRTCDRLDCEILIVPRLFEAHGGYVGEHLWGFPLVRLPRAAFRSWEWRAKRATDVTAATLALLVLSPVLTLVALAVRLDTGPGVLFKQVRVGVDGRPFRLLKFRTYRPLAASDGDTQWSVSDDSRLSRVARFLRKTSLDELPQLWNILRGDMTFVGPRPERPHFVDRFSQLYPRYTARHRVPAGLTGWAQVHGLRGDTSIADRARFDNAYIENWSWWGDVKIILRTVASVVRGSGG